MKFGPFKKRSRSPSFSHLYIALKYLKYRYDPFQSTRGVKYYSVKKMKTLLRLHAGKVPVVKINTFANARMFIHSELKDITFGE